MKITIDHNAATLMTPSKASDLAVKLNAEEKDGWRYRAGWMILETQAQNNRSWGIEIRDEEGEFIGYL
jgi:hypothetical protein